REALIANEGIPEHRVSVIYNGVDLRPFGQATDREAARRDMGVKAEHRVLVQVARLDYLKDHATAVRTLERVVAQQPEARLVLIGDGPERPTIEREIHKRGLTEQVRLMGQPRDAARPVAAAGL